jgi:hypothetical protein
MYRYSCTAEPTSLLEIPVEHLDRRVGLCFGSSDEVARFKTFLFGGSAYTRYSYKVEDNTNYDVKDFM